MTNFTRGCLSLSVLLAGAAAHGQTLRVSFDAGVEADHAAGRREPWVNRSVEAVPGKFGKAVRVQPGGQLIYAGEQNIQAGRGTLACWCRIPERPGPQDVERLIFVQAKERGYWNYLATLEWQESAFRAMVFDFYHGHGWHDPTGLSAFTANDWHHVALVWDQAHGAKFFLDGKLTGSTWGKQAWWERPTPHAIHLSYPGAEYDELCIYDQALTDEEVAELARAPAREFPAREAPPARAAAGRLVSSLGSVGAEKLPTIELSSAPRAPVTVIRQARVRQILDDKIPAWKVMDGRMSLFWPEWRAPVLGDVDYSGSELSVTFEPDQQLTHLVLRGLVGGCRVFGERNGYVSREPIADVSPGLHFLAASELPPRLTGLRVPRREGMKLQEITVFAVEPRPATSTPSPLGGEGWGEGSVVTPVAGPIQRDQLGTLADEIATRTLPDERLVLGRTAAPEQRTHPIAALSRVHFVTDPVAEATPLAALALRLQLVAAWTESIWWLRVPDPVNPRRDLVNVPLRVINPAPNEQVTFDVVLDFWDILLDPGSRLWVELLPRDDLQLVTAGPDAPGGSAACRLTLIRGRRDKVLAEFAHTQSQLAYSYWQLGSEADGSRGADPNAPGFALLGHITENRELRLTMEWVRRYVPDQPLVNNLWRVIYESAKTAPVTPRLEPPGAPEWAVWGRELLERFRAMAHHWADWQSPDGQVGGGWNDDTDFPGVFICLPLLGDEKTQTMFERIYDGVERTDYLHNGVSRSPIDALHATDFLSWRAHLILFDYGEPRHVERALVLARELEKWTTVDAAGHRRFRTGYYSEDGPSFAPKTEVGDSGLIEHTGAGIDSGTNRNFLRDLLFAAWYSRNPTLLKFIREVAEADYARAAGGANLGAYESYPFYSYFTLFGDRKFLSDPLDRFVRDRWNVPIWRRVAERLPDGNRLDAELLRATSAKAAYEESLTAAYLVGRDKSVLARALRESCERLEGGWQFRGGAAGGANDHFYVPGQAALSQMYLGSALTWLRPASIIPPIAVSWEGIDADVAALVLEASPQKLRVAAYNFADQPRPVRMRLWELAAGKYQLREGLDANRDDQIDGSPLTRELSVDRSTPVDLMLPSRTVQLIEFHQLQAKRWPELLADLAVGAGDIFYDKATDRLKVIVHNIGAAAAENVAVRFQTPDGQLLGERVIERLEAPLDLEPKAAVVWLPQPTLHPVPHIVVRVDPDGQVDEITRENNAGAWTR